MLGGVNLAVAVSNLADILFVSRPRKIQGECELGIIIYRALNLLLNAQVASLFAGNHVHRHRPQARQSELHPAGGAGSAALGVKQRQGVLTNCVRTVFGKMLSQVDILACRLVDTADITDQLVVQEQPQVVVTEEAVLQRPDVVLGDGKLKLELHPEVGVMVDFVIGHRSNFVPIRLPVSWI